MCLTTWIQQPPVDSSEEAPVASAALASAAPVPVPAAPVAPAPAAPGSPAAPVASVPAAAADSAAPASPASSSSSIPVPVEPTGPVYKSAMPRYLREKEVTSLLTMRVDQTLRGLPKPASLETMPRQRASFPLTLVRNLVGGKPGIFTNISNPSKHFTGCTERISVKPLEHDWVPKAGVHTALTLVEDLDVKQFWDDESPMFSCDKGKYEYLGQFKAVRKECVSMESWLAWPKEKQDFHIERVRAVGGRVHKKPEFLTKREFKGKNKIKPDEEEAFFEPAEIRKTFGRVRSHSSLPLSMNV